MGNSPSTEISIPLNASEISLSLKGIQVHERALSVEAYLLEHENKDVRAHVQKHGSKGLVHAQIQEICCGDLVAKSRNSELYVVGKMDMKIMKDAKLVLNELQFEDDFQKTENSVGHMCKNRVARAAEIRELGYKVNTTGKKSIRNELTVDMSNPREVSNFSSSLEGCLVSNMGMNPTVAQAEATLKVMSHLDALAKFKRAEQVEAKAELNEFKIVLGAMDETTDSPYIEAYYFNFECTGRSERTGSAFLGILENNHMQGKMAVVCEKAVFECISILK